MNNGLKKQDFQRKFLPHQRIAIFIDAENVEMSGYNIYGGRTDYKKLLKALGDMRQISRIIYYKPEHKEISDDFKKFWFELGGEIKQPIKNVDPWLIVDAVTMAEKLDAVVIVGGDKDYLPLIWFLKSRGCKAEIWSYPETVSAIVQQTADYFFGMDETFIIKDSSRPAKKRPPARPMMRSGRPQSSTAASSSTSSTPSSSSSSSNG